VKRDQDFGGPCTGGAKVWQKGGPPRHWGREKTAPGALEKRVVLASIIQIVILGQRIGRENERLILRKIEKKGGS